MVKRKNQQLKELMDKQGDIFIKAYKKLGKTDEDVKAMQEENLKRMWIKFFQMLLEVPALYTRLHNALWSLSMHFKDFQTLGKFTDKEFINIFEQDDVKLMIKKEIAEIKSGKTLPSLDFIWACGFMLDGDRLKRLTQKSDYFQEIFKVNPQYINYSAPGMIYIFYRWYLDNKTENVIKWR